MSEKLLLVILFLMLIGALIGVLGFALTEYVCCFTSVNCWCWL